LHRCGLGAPVADGMTDAPKTHAKAGPNDGRRTSKNMGRPLGSRDRFPRQRSSVVRGGLEERFRQLESAYGAAQALIAELQDQLRAQQVFDGDALALLRATQRGEYVPSNVQLYAAKVIFDKELDQRRIELDGHRAALEDERREYADGGERLAQLVAEFGEFVRDRSDELDALVAAGDVTPTAAQEIRSWFVRDEPLALPALSAAEPATTASDIDRYHSTNRPLESPQPVEPVAEPAPPLDAISRILFAPRPFACFQTASGRRFEADSDAVVELDGADDDDIKDLLHSGCREKLELTI
jgi:hypothetical protein